MTAPRPETYVRLTDIVADLVLSRLGNTGTDLMDDLLTKLHSRLAIPGELTVTGSNKVVSVGSTVVDIGPSGKKLSLPQLNGIDLGNRSGTMNFGTGVGTGDVQTVSLPTMTASYFIKAGFEVRENGNIVVVFGVEGVSASAATAPAFSENATRLGYVILQDDGTGGTGNYSNVTYSSVYQFGGVDVGLSSEQQEAQDRNLKFVRGGTFAWNSTTNSLSWSANAYIQVPGLIETRNTILAGNVTLASDGQVAYVEVNRSGATPANLTVSVSSINALVDTPNTVIIARRVGSDILVGNGTILLKNGEYLELDGALAEINRYFGQLRMSKHETAANKVRVASATQSMLDGNSLVQELSNLLIDFSGAVINFQTGAILKEDDSTALGINFTPFSVPASQYFWYGVALTPSGVGADNRIGGQILITPAASANAVLASAPAPAIGGNKKLGAVLVYNNAGSIEVVRVEKLGVGSGSGGSGSGSGVGDDINALQFKASFTDLFTDLTSSANSAVDYGAGKTDSATFDVANELHRISYDASKTVTGTGTAMTLSGAPSFTIKQGDLLIVGNEVRRILTVPTQTTPTIDAAFTTDPAAAACNVSQAIYTKDLNNFAGDGLAISSAFSGAISQLMVTYEDSLAAGDKIFDNTDPALIGFSASSDDSSYTDKKARVGSLADEASIVDLPSSGTNMYLRFFSNATSGSGAANLLAYKAFFHKDTSLVAEGGIVEQAFGFTDGTGAEVGCSAPTVVSGKTRITFSWTYPVGVNAGKPNGAIKGWLNGAKLPRYIDDTITPDNYFKEINANTVELSGDFSGQNLSFEFTKDVAIVDASTDNSSNISAIQSLVQAGFSGFVDESAKLTATTVAPLGPAATGTFYSTVVNRAQIPDITANLKAHFGIERIQVQQIYEMVGEFGPNGEKVWAAVNDDKGLLRFVGKWQNNYDVLGTYISANFDSSAYYEVTFYGTGLNLLGAQGGSTQQHEVSIDGGSFSANVFPALSTVIDSRNYVTNHTIPLASGLTLGVHTIRVRNTNAANIISGYGFEVINDSSLRIQPGTSYINGKKLVSSSQAIVAYNSGADIESGVVGTRGGRMLVYHKADGTVKRAFNPSNLSDYGTLGSANHANEEIIRSYQPREFGSGRADDFSGNYANGSSLAFTLDDGTTTLVGSVVRAAGPANTLTEGGLQLPTNAGFWTFTFVGTGLDLIMQDDGTSNSENYQISVDGVALPTLTTSNAALGKFLMKVVSGLPYGTHTVKLTRVVAAASSRTVYRFIVYGPKKPALPAGAVELADYFLMADFAANSTAGVETIATGVLRKQASREFIYGGGAWGINLFTTAIGGVNPGTNTTTNYFEYTFWGTGFEHRAATNTAGSGQIDVLLNGIALTSANYGTAVFSTYGGFSFNSGTGALDGNNSTTNGSGFRVSGLPLAKYTVRFTMTGAGAPGMSAEALDIITPIHSPKSNLYADLQNTLPIGSCAISDNRNTSPLKELSASKKAWAQAFGTSASPSTTSTVLVPVPELSCSVKTSSNYIRVNYAITWNHSAGGSDTAFAIYVDGVVVSSEQTSAVGTAAANASIADDIIVPISPGVHKVDVYWKVSAGTATLLGTKRNLTVEEK